MPRAARRRIVLGIVFGLMVRGLGGGVPLAEVAVFCEAFVGKWKWFIGGVVLINSYVIVDAVVKPFLFADEGLSGSGRFREWDSAVESSHYEPEDDAQHDTTPRCPRHPQSFSDGAPVFGVLRWARSGA